jgi:hypothetical protein
VAVLVNFKGATFMEALSDKQFTWTQPWKGAFPVGKSLGAVGSAGKFVSLAVGPHIRRESGGS